MAKKTAKKAVPATKKNTASKKASPAKKAAAKKAATAATEELVNPPREVVKPDVQEAIRKEAKRNKAHEKKPDKYALLEAGDETLTLGTDLLIGLTRRKALRADYTDISMGKHGGRAVAQTAAGDATTVAKAIKLVHEKSNDKQ